MRIRLQRTLYCFLFTFIMLISLTGHASTALMDGSISSMLQKVLPAVVNIRAQIKVTDFNTLHELQKHRRGQGADSDNESGIPDTLVSVASGVIVDAKNGYILTNAHVINDAQVVIITLNDGRHYTAKIIGNDKPSDVALLQIKAKNLTAIPLGDSNQLKVGDFVAAIGNPFGLNQTVTSGIVSALGRTTLGIENYENFIQTDAPINPGNSGGALISAQGELIGINTAILAPDRGNIGIGFAIPANMAKSVMQQLIQYGNVRRGALGIAAQDITPELATAFNINTTKGAAVTQVLPNSPAQQADIQVGDIITAVNNSNIKNASEVVNTIAFLRVDSKISIDLLRNNKHLKVSAVITDPKKRQQSIAQMDPFLHGVGFKNFSILSPIHGSVKGVLVVSVEEDSNAWQADLKPGDVITSVNQEKISSIDELKAITKKADHLLLLNVLRGPSAVFLVINREDL
jgi:serine protease Do